MLVVVADDKNFFYFDLDWASSVLLHSLLIVFYETLCETNRQNSHLWRQSITAIRSWRPFLRGGVNSEILLRQRLFFTSRQKPQNDGLQRNQSGLDYRAIVSEMAIMSFQSISFLLTKNCLENNCWSILSEHGRCCCQSNAKLWSKTPLSNNVGKSLISWSVKVALLV